MSIFLVAICYAFITKGKRLIEMISIYNWYYNYNRYALLMRDLYSIYIY
jgi:hypothetical protein